MNWYEVNLVKRGGTNFSSVTALTGGGFVLSAFCCLASSSITIIDFSDVLPTKHSENKLAMRLYRSCKVDDELIYYIC